MIRSVFLCAYPILSAPAHHDIAAEAFVAWAAEVAIPMDLDAGIDPDLLWPLVENRRFVFLGEPDHYIHEKYSFRLEFLYALHELGWRHLGMEMGRSDGLRFDRFLESGDQDVLLDVGLYRSAKNSQATPRTGFLHMELWYANEVRRIAADSDRIRYFGFDVDTTPGNGFLDARSRLKGVPGTLEVATRLDEAWNGDNRHDALDALLEELRQVSSPLREGLPETQLADLIADLDALTASLRFRDEAGDLSGEAIDLVGAFTRREQAMFRVMDHHLAGLPPDEGVALTGHNMHLCRNHEGARWFEMDSVFPVPLWPTIGAQVTRDFPGEVFAIWLVYDHGERAPAALAANTVSVPSVPGTVESLLARLPHESCLLPLQSDDPRSAWLDEERTFRVNGGVGHGRLRELADALFFVREVKPPGRMD